MSAIPVATLLCGALLLYGSRSEILLLPPDIRFRYWIPVTLSYIWRGQTARAAIGASGLKQHHRFKIEYTRLIVQSLISILLVVASLYVMLSSSSAESDKHWASGTLGMILGFWLRGSHDPRIDRVHKS
jgi:hypothetical protein